MADLATDREFGFRIHGSKPVVVSAIEPDTPAESSGLEVGDIVLSVNGINVLDKSHSEVVKIAHAGSDTLSLEVRVVILNRTDFSLYFQVARTCGVLSPTSAADHVGVPIYSGYLWKLGGYASGVPTNKWIRRWFVLKKDNCLYFYKTDVDKQPVGAMMLQSYEICREDDNSPGVQPRPYRFCIRRTGMPTLHLAADNEPTISKWLEVLANAVEESQIADTWLEQARRNLTLAPNAIPKPDCFGYLVKLGTQWKSWSRRYCVLKDACLYFYQDANSRSAFGVACLHGYKVQQTASGSKKHAFEILAPEPGQKHFYFHTESDMDRKR
ncbi:pdz domain [Holotrichia oblita]|uniref:Pdz domain n=1 Tax=Holotrichia oblita TaxID=644536 RepID=A0ACB9SQ77_HOLOL|nr:pdz domain [Holotrichia oblita]